MKVLVTGGAGFIGSHTVDLLLERGYLVRILDSLAEPVHHDGKRPAYLPAEAEFMLGDVRNRSDLEHALDGADAVIHLAAYQDYLPDFSKFFHVNAVGTALIYELIVEKRLPIRKVVVASSQAAYGEGKYVCPAHAAQYPDPRPVQQLMAREWELRCPVCEGPLAVARTDEAVMKPHNQYAMSKEMEEKIALQLGKRYGIPSVALRYSITQGPRQSFSNAYSGVLRIFTQRLLSDRQPVVYEDGKQLRDYVYVGDVAKANLLALEDERADYQSFNVGGAEAVTVLEYASLVAGVLGKRIDPILPGEFRFGDTRHVISDVSKLRSLGWEPSTQLVDIITRYASWAVQQPGLRDYYQDAEVVMKRLGTLRLADPS